MKLTSYSKRILAKDGCTILICQFVTYCVIVLHFTTKEKKVNCFSGFWMFLGKKMSLFHRKLRRFDERSENTKSLHQRLTQPKKLQELLLVLYYFSWILLNCLNIFAKHCCSFSKSFCRFVDFFRIKEFYRFVAFFRIKEPFIVSWRFVANGFRSR